MSATAARLLKSDPAVAPGQASRKVRRVAYLVESALSERNRDRLGVTWMADQGIEVRALDVGPLTLPELPGDRSVYARYRGFAIESIASQPALRQAVSTLAKADLVVSLVGTGHLTPRNVAVYRALAAAGAPYLILSVNAYPGWTGEATDGNPGEALRRLAQRLTHLDPAKSLAARLPLSWLGVPPARFAVYGGRKSRTANRFVDETTIPIAAHSMDYEAFREAAARRGAPTETAVFIDEYRPYHPDLAEMGRAYTAEQAAYYFARMRDLFDRVERELGLKVVVAAMPKADYSDKPGVYGGRAIEYGRTADLIGASRLVLAHRSTAIGWAVMFEKPILQIATRDIYAESVQKPYFDAFAAALGKPIQFCDDPAAVDLARAFDMDRTRYAAFRRDYVTEAETDRPFWEIVLAAVEKALPADGR